MVDRDPVDYTWDMPFTATLQEIYTSLDTDKNTLIDLSSVDPLRKRSRVLRRLVADIDDLMTQIEEML